MKTYIKMTSRSGSLSDEYILAHCQRYRPIPLGAAQYILMKDLQPQHEHAFGNKPLKYHTQMARPKDFDTLAKAITKMSGNPMVRDELNSVYAKDLQSVPRLMTHSAASSGSTGTDSGVASARPLSTRRVQIVDYSNGNGNSSDSNGNGNSSHSNGDGSDSGYQTPTPPSGPPPDDISPRSARLKTKATETPELPHRFKQFYPPVGFEREFEFETRRPDVGQYLRPGPQEIERRRQEMEEAGTPVRGGLTGKSGGGYRMQLDRPPNYRLQEDYSGDYSSEDY